ncbi:MBL fold metallo-hydrolase [Eggerthia catenaformis]
MKYHILASGSKGNAAFIYENNTGVLIDCGITRKQLLFKLDELGYSQDDISYVLLTHDHNDHNKNIGIFDKDIVYTAKGNIKELDQEHELIPYQEYQMGHFNIFVLKLSHDATNTIGFVIRGEESFLYMTDTGYVSRKNRQYIQDLNYYVIEANHDIEMLMNTRRPLFLKNRILGDLGHLNNEYSARLMNEIMGENTKEIILAHLSQEANTKELALHTYYDVFDELHNSFDKKKIRCADQFKVLTGGRNDN